MYRYVQCLFLGCLLSLVLGSAPLWAAITVTYGSAGQTTGLGSTQIDLSPPAGTQAGDVLIAQIATPGNHVTTFGAPAGWTLISAASSTGGTDLDQRIYYLTLAGAAAGSYTWTVWDWAYQSSGVIYAVRGALPPDCGAAATAICAGSKQTGAGSSVIAPNVGPSFAAGTLRMAFFSDSDGSATIAPSTSNGETLGRYNRAGSGATGIGIHGSYYLLGSAGNGGSSTATLGNSQSNIGSTLLLASGAVSPHHIQLEITGTPLTCTPASVTVKACTDAACSTLSSSSTTVTLSTSGGNWASSPLTFTGSTTATLAVRNTTAVTLGASSSPGASNATLCYVGGVLAASCAVSFADSGLLLTVPTLTAGVTSSFSVKAVKKSDNSLACTPAFASVTRTVDFWTNYSSPITGTKTVAVNGTSVGMNAVSTGGSTAATGTAVSLKFDATGTATYHASNTLLSLNYADAGQLSLNARYDGSAGTSDANLVMTGSTAFVSVPYALCVDSPDTNWGCAAADTSCTKFTSAGTPFKLSVTGKAYQAATAICSLPTTPNYVQSGLVLSSTLVAPAAAVGGVNAMLSPTSLSIASAGTATQATQTVSEVGVFTITATPPAGAYFGQTVLPGVSGNSGRFVPAYFTTAVTPACGVGISPPSPFSYSGQLFSMSITANRAGGGATINYSGNFARATTISDAGNATNFTNNSRLATDFSSGVAAPNNVTYTFPANGNSTLTLRAVDADGTSSSGFSEAALKVQSGRVRIWNAYGSELLNLQVPMRAEYWTGSVWATNTADNCTIATLAFTQVGSSDIRPSTCVFDIGKPGNSSMGCPTVAASSLQFREGVISGFSGNFNLNLQKTGAGKIGTIEITATVPDWMKYTWTSAARDNPRSLASFGKKGPSNLIYMREVY